jgi:hypothetical protein
MANGKKQKANGNHLLHPPYSPDPRTPDPRSIKISRRKLFDFIVENSIFAFENWNDLQAAPDNHRRGDQRFERSPFR